MEKISFRERFFGLPNPHAIGGGLYAPSTLGAPEFTHQTDYKIFKKDLAEKVESERMRKEHKAALVRYYGAGNVGRNLNYPLG